MSAVWPDTVVEENNLSQSISKLRSVLGESPGDHRWIVTLPGRGYRFVADVRLLASGKESTARTSDCQGRFLSGIRVRPQPHRCQNKLPGASASVLGAFCSQDCSRGC